MSRHRHRLPACVAVATLLVAVLPMGGAPAAASTTGDAITVGMERACADAPEGRFPDVPRDSVHAAAIDCAAASNIVRGATDGGYHPSSIVTRGQMASFVADLMRERYEFRLPVPDAFDDDDGNVHEFAIDLLSSVGVVAGTGGRRYGPNAPVTRAQMTTYLVRAFETATQSLLPAGGNRFGDDDGNVHEPNIDRAAAASLAQGTTATTFAPGAAVRRDQMASFVVRTLGCMSLSAEDPSCAAYAGGGIDGFSLSATVDRSAYTVGDAVVVRVEACNRRPTTLQQQFPQRDWATVEMLNTSLPAGWNGHLDWYDSRLYSLAGNGYGGERDLDPIHHRIGSRSPRLVSLTWVDGPQTSPTQVVTWQPGECRILPLAPWSQADNTVWGSGSDWVAEWSAPADPPGRARPGPYVARVHWGGVEVGMSRRFVSADSARFTLDGPSIDVRLDQPPYAVGTEVGVVVEACNRSDAVYEEPWAVEDRLEEEVLSVAVRVDRGPRTITRVHHPAGTTLRWEPGQCRQWRAAWDQRNHAGELVTSDAVSVEVAWHGQSGSVDRYQYHGSDILRLR